MTTINTRPVALDRLTAAYGQLIALSEIVGPSPLALELANAEADILWRHVIEKGPTTAGEALALLVHARSLIGMIAFSDLEPGQAATIAEAALAVQESALAFLINAAPWADRAAVAPVAAYHFLDAGDQLADSASAAPN